MPKIVQNHGGLQPLLDLFHIPATVFAETMVCLNKIDTHFTLFHNLQESGASSVEFYRMMRRGQDKGSAAILSGTAQINS